MRESVIETKGTERFEAFGWLARKVAYIGRRNAPDRWYFKAGILAIVEYKRDDEEPNEGQQREIRRLRRAGMRVYSVDSIPAVFALIDRLEAEIDARV